MESWGSEHAGTASARGKGSSLQIGHPGRRPAGDLPALISVVRIHPPNATTRRGLQANMSPRPWLLPAVTQKKMLWSDKLGEPRVQAHQTGFFIVELSAFAVQCVLGLLRGDCFSQHLCRSASGHTFVSLIQERVSQSGARASLLPGELVKCRCLGHTPSFCISDVFSGDADGLRTTL